jgi:hypothetical protein
VCGIDESLFTDISEETIEQIEEVVNENKLILKTVFMPMYTTKTKILNFYSGAVYRY